MTAYRTMFNHVRKAIDLHDATAHAFRHSYLTLLDEAGVDPKTLQSIAGHGNFSFTLNRYVHGRERDHAGWREVRGIAQSGGADSAVRAGWRIAGCGRVTSCKFRQT